MLVQIWFHLGYLNFAILTSGRCRLFVVTFRHIGERFIITSTDSSRQEMQGVQIRVIHRS